MTPRLPSGACHALGHRLLGRQAKTCATGPSGVTGTGFAHVWQEGERLPIAAVVVSRTHKQDHATPSSGGYVLPGFAILVELVGAYAAG